MLTIYWNNKCSTVLEYCQNQEGYVGLRPVSEGVPGCVAEDTGAVVPLTEIIPQFIISPAEDYFNGKMLGLNKNKQGEMYTWDDFGSIQWELVLCQLFGWTLSTLANIRGVKSLGKAAYVFTLMPYVVITILLIYSATLDGASDGIDYYLSADWSKLEDFGIWIDAMTQIVSSVGLGTGTHMALSSFNARDNKVHFDAAIISSLNSVSSFYIGCAIFLMTGFLAYQTGVPVENVNASKIPLFVPLGLVCTM